MAYAKELTIALGQTVYAGDSESDERVTSQEARVEVTYVLEQGDMDVPLLATVKAAEVQHALVAARQQLRRQEAAEARPAASPASGQGSNGNSPFKPGAGSPASTRPYGTGTRQGNGYARTQPPLDGLTKDEGKQLLQALQQDEREQTGREPAMH
jgi:cytochrome c553